MTGCINERGGCPLDHLGPSACDFIERDATALAHTPEDAVGHVEELVGTIELLEQMRWGFSSCGNGNMLTAILPESKTRMRS